MPDEKQVKVKFTQDHVVQDTFEGTKDEAAYRKGRTYSMSEASARHFTSRGLAETVTKAKPRQKPVPEPDDSGKPDPDADPDGGAGGGPAV